MRRIFNFVFLSTLFLNAVISVRELRAESGASLVSPEYLGSSYSSEFRKAFLDETGRWSLEKISQIKKLVEIRRSEISRNIIQFELSKGATREDAEKELKGDDVYQTHAHLLSLIEKLQEYARLSRVPFSRSIETAQLILEVDFALKVEGTPRPLVNQIQQTISSQTPWNIDREQGRSQEALNLIDGSSGTFHRAVDLAKLKNADTLQPRSLVNVWEDSDIERVDVRARFEQGQGALYEGLKIQFPKENYFYLKSVRKAQSKPKLNVYIFDENGKKVSYKLKVGREIHSEVTASALSTALGFYNDVSRQRSGVKLYLKDMNFEELKREWHSYYVNFDIERYLLKSPKGNFVERDTRLGLDYVVFQQALIESRISGATRVGSWPYWKNGHSSLREVRALMLFDMWIGNLDLKEQENNKFLIRENKDGSFHYFAMQHDVGFSFGVLLMPEAVDAFPWNLVIDPDPKSDSIEFNYRTFQDTSGRKIITEADMKWMARRIARLSRAQITDAVRLGGWPESVGSLLIEKLISRRNDLVKAFGLDQEGVAILPCDQNISTPDGRVQNGKLVKARFENFPHVFGFDYEVLKKNIVKPIETALVEGTQGAIATVSTLSVDPVNIGIPGIDIANVIVQTRREYERNPHPATEEESYIIKDTIKLGFELGAGLVIGGRGEYTITYHLLYTAKTKEGALRNRAFLKNLFLPVEKWDLEFPKNSVFITEAALEGGGFFKTDDFSTLVSIGLQSNISKVLLHRSIVSTRTNGKIRLFEDKSLYNDVTARVFLRLALLKLPVMRESMSKGRIWRSGLELDRSDLDRNAELQALYKRAVLLGRVHELEGRVRGFELNSKFKENNFKFSLLGALGLKRNVRVDEIRRSLDLPTLSGGGAGESAPLYNVQISNTRTRSWALFDNSEEFVARVFLISEPSLAEGELKNPMLQLSYTTDDSDTRSKEISEKYIEFANDAAHQEILKFSPELFTINGLWGQTHTYVNFIYKPQAIEFLLNPEKLDLKDLERRFQHSLQRGSLGYVRSQRLISYLRMARQQKTGIKKMEYITKALASVVHKRLGEFHGKALGVLHARIIEALGADAIYMNAVIANDGSKENIFPAGVPVSGEIGKRPRLPEPVMLLMDSSPTELYYSL